MAFRINSFNLMRLILVCILYSLFGYTSESMASLNQAFKFHQEQQKDTRAPKVIITSPESTNGNVNKPFSILPEFKGTAIDEPQSPTIPASGVVEVKGAVGYISSNGGRAWDGATWKPVTTSQEIPFFPAQFSGTEWSFRIAPKLPNPSELPFLATLTILIQAKDKEGNIGTTELAIFMRPPTVNVIDAYLGVKEGVDFTAPLSQADLIKLAELSKSPENSIQRAALDGATKLVVIARGNSPVAVSFDKQYSEFQNPLDDLLVNASTSSMPTRIQPHLILDGEYYWFAVYTMPSFVTSETTYQIRFKAWFSDGTYDYPEWYNLGQVQVAPVPVLFVHGIWSDKNTWKSQEFNQPGVPENLRGAIPYAVALGWSDSFYVDFAREKAVGIVNYRNTNAAHFEANKDILLFNQGDTINSLLDSYRKTKTACTRVDVIAHSMGGVLTRLFYQQPYYRNKENYNKGYIRRLVTIGTPHLGTPIADVAWRMIADDSCKRVRREIESAGRPLLQGAVEDLRVCSPALKTINGTALPSYSITAEDNELEGDLYKLSWAVWYCNGFKDPFQNMPNDGVVSTESQAGGIETSQPFMFTDHYSETTSHPIALKVVNLLTRSIGALAVGYPSISSVCSGTSNVERHPVAPVQEHGQITQQDFSLKIISPIQSQTFKPNDQITVSVSAEQGVTIAGLVIFFGTGELGQAKGFTSSPFTATFKVPSSYIGALPILAIARDINGRESLAEANIVIQSNAQLQRIDASYTSLSLSSKGSFVSLQITGAFSDGITRDLTLKEAGTTYSSDNMNVALVDENGVITAVGQGATRVKATNQNQSVEIPVNVQFEVPFVEQVSLPEVALGEIDKDLNIFGKHLGGATKVEFFLNGILDSNVTATITSTDAPGVYSAVRAKITVATGAVLGKRAVVITTPGGVSVKQALLKNVLTIVPRASRTIGPPREPIKRGDGRRIQ